MDVCQKIGGPNIAVCACLVSLEANIDKAVLYVICGFTLILEDNHMDNNDFLGVRDGSVLSLLGYLERETKET